MSLPELVLAVAMQFLVAPPPPPITVGTGTNSLTWDAVTTDINGKPETLLGYKFGVFPKGTTFPDAKTPTSVMRSFFVPPTSVEIAMATIQGTTPLPAGEYVFAVQAVDAAGNPGPWTSEPTTLDVSPPAAPKSLRLKISAVIDVEFNQ